MIGDSQFLAEERASRLRTSLDAADGNYDQVVAVSQRMINLGLKKIYQSNQDAMGFFEGKSSMPPFYDFPDPLLAQAVLTQTPVYGSISASLEASEILIPVDLANSYLVYWVWNFGPGLFTAKVPNEPDHQLQTKGWRIAVKVPLINQVMADDPDDSAKLKELKAAQRKWIAENFVVKGDYRPERLYAKMASAWWDSMSFMQSSFTVNGKLMNWNNWQHDPETKRVANALKMTLNDICQERELAGLTSAGVNFKFDQSVPLDPKTATYPPRQLQHQAYPYRIPASSGMVGKQWQEGIEDSEQEPGPRNCLLYCELVDDRPFHGVQLPHVGNFSAIGGAQGTPAPIDGTFILSHQLLFERFLLPKLQVFVQQSQIYPKPPVFWNDPPDSIHSKLGYICGANPLKDPTNDPALDIYKFSYKKGSDGKPFYEAHVDCTQEADPFPTPVRGLWTKFYAEGSPTVQVRWTPGSRLITVTGQTNYLSHGTTAKSNQVDPTSHLLPNPESWWHGRYEMSWIMTIEVKAENGSLTMNLSHSGNFIHLVPKPDDAKGWQWDDPTTPRKIEETITTSMNSQLSWLERVLKAGFEDQLKFHYPGNGQLDFGETILNEKGDLLAEIKYKDLPVGKIVLEKPVKSEDPPATGGRQVEVKVGNVPAKMRLDWKAVTPVTVSKKSAVDSGVTSPAMSSQPAASQPEADQPAASQSASSQPEQDNRIEIRMTGTNVGTTPVYLGNIMTTFEGNSSGKIAAFTPLRFVVGPPVGPGGAQDEIEITAEIQPKSTDNVDTGLVKNVYIGLKTQMVHRKYHRCTAEFQSQSSSVPITIPPGGSISLIAKGISGQAGVYTFSLSEGWTNDKGIANTSEPGLSTTVNVELKD